MQMGQSLTELKTKVLNKIVDDSNLVKAIVIDSADFLTATPTDEQNAILRSPTQLIRKQIIPHRKVTATTNKAKPYITSSWMGFKKSGNMLRSGTVYFYIIIPDSLEETDYGSRYDYIADRIDAILTEKNNIGEFEFEERGDIIVEGDKLGHCIIFKIVDFYGVDINA